MKRKKKKLKHKRYILLLEGYSEWLGLLGYAKESIRNFKNHVGEFLYWLESLGFLEIGEVGRREASLFMTWLSTRVHHRGSGGLSVSYINGSVKSLNKLEEYLREVKGIDLDLSMPYKREGMISEREILSIESVNLLYASCENNAIGLRDCAMLGLYYGCGLRRSEGVGLLLSDINIGRKLLKVRKSKTHRQRYVPIALKVLEDFENYIEESRLDLLDKKRCSHFLVRMGGGKISGQSMNLRLKYLLKKSGLSSNLSLHNLRHSIGSHLLWKGLRLEEVGSFLGHVSLDSTQLYTRLMEEQALKNLKA